MITIVTNGAEIIVDNDLDIVMSNNHRLRIMDGILQFNIPEFPDNAAALAGNVRNGETYCTRNENGEFIVKRCTD